MAQTGGTQTPPPPPPTQNGGGPIKLSVVHNPPTAPAPTILPVPEDVRAAATHEQLVRLAQIELEFAHKVSRELARAYDLALTVLRGPEGEAGG